LTISLDATYSLGDHLSGVGVYSRELMAALAAAHPEQRFLRCYRPHRFLRALAQPVPANTRRALLYEPLFPRARDFFHGLNQRVPEMPFRRTVTTFHDLFVLSGDYSTPDFRRRFTAQARRAAAASDAVIAVSAFTAGQVADLLGVERARIHVVHHGTEHLTPISGVARENIVLNVGAVQKRKNIVRLVQAFEQTPPGWKLVIAGSEGYGSSEILDRITASRRRADIQVLGYVSAAELARLYARARIFAFPSLDEGFGMPVLEAMISGVPVVAGDRSALPEVCGEAAILVDPEDVSDIAAALCRLMDDGGERNRLIGAGYSRAREFSWERAAAQTWNVYRMLLAG